MIYSATVPRVPLFGAKRALKDKLRESLTDRLSAMWDLYGSFDIDAETIGVLEGWASEGFEPM